MGDTMNGKDEFNEFVKGNPKLIRFVRDGKKTWQDFYEIFNLYGTDSNAWKEYLDDRSSKSVDFLSFIKAIDLDSIQNSVSSIQRVLGVVQDLTVKDSVSKDEYTPRPLYKHFED